MIVHVPSTVLRVMSELFSYSMRKKEFTLTPDDVVITSWEIRELVDDRISVDVVTLRGKISSVIKNNNEGMKVLMCIYKRTEAEDKWLVV